MSALLFHGQRCVTLSMVTVGNANAAFASAASPATANALVIVLIVCFPFVSFVDQYVSLMCLTVRDLRKSSKVVLGSRGLKVKVRGSPGMSVK